MIEIIELITAITVLLASLAGFSAVNKWKKETFEKKKTKIIDAYEENLYFKIAELIKIKRSTANQIKQQAT